MNKIAASKGAHLFYPTQYQVYFGLNNKADNGGSGGGEEGGDDKKYYYRNSRDLFDLVEQIYHSVEMFRNE